MRFSGRGLPILFVLVLLATRLLFLLAALDPAEERVMEVLDPAYRSWSNGPVCPIYDGEELYVGTAAETICQGAGIPTSAYRFMPYGSAGLAAVLIAVPLFRLLGPYYLVLKIIPMLVTILGGLAWLLVARAWLGERAARLFGLLYILAPPVLARTALIEMGGHPEAMAWIGWVAFLATCAWRRHTPRAQMVFAAAAGALAGLGVWVTYSTVPITGALLIASLLITRFRPRAAWISAGVGLAVGLVPWLIVVIGTSGAALQIYGRSIGATVQIGAAAERIGLLLATGFIAGYDLPGGGAVRMVAGWVWLLAVAFGAARLILSGRRTLAILIGAGMIAHVAAFLLVAPDSSSRYLVPVYPFLLLIVVAALLPRRREPEPTIGRVPLVGVGAALALGLLSQMTVVLTSTYPALRAPLKGTYWPHFGEAMGRKLTAEGIRSIPRSMRPFLWVGYGERIFLAVEPSRWRAEAMEAGPDSARVWEGIGIPWMSSRVARQAPALLRRLPAQDRLYMGRGLSYGAGPRFARMAVAAPQQIPPLLEGLDPQDRPILSTPLARVLGVLDTQLRERPFAPADPVLTEEERLRGIGWSLYRGSRVDGTIRFWRTPPAAAPDPVWQGIADAYEWELRTRDNRWLLGAVGPGPRAGPRALLEEVARLTRGMPPGRAALFYRSAGRSAAVAFQEPSRDGREDPATWRSRSAVPPMFRAPFDQGFAEGIAGFGP